MLSTRPGESGRAGGMKELKISPKFLVQFPIDFLK
jgi:hypothetical protein